MNKRTGKQIAWCWNLHKAIEYAYVESGIIKPEKLGVYNIYQSAGVINSYFLKK